MPTLTVRKLPENVHRALKAQAACHGRSTEAEVRDIISNAVLPDERFRLGDFLYELGRDVGLTEEEFALFTSVRDKTPAEPPPFD